MSLDTVFHRLQADVKGFRALADELKKLAGISLPENPKNLSLMASRLHSVISDRGLAGYQQYLGLILRGDPAVCKEFVQALTTNTTQFFRESRHFDFLKSLLPGIMGSKTGVKDFRIWCAAASTGQEPYTLAMTLFEGLPNPQQTDLRFLATDIDTDVLATGAKGIYTDKETVGIPPALRQKYFVPVVQGGSRCWQANEALRKAIRFANLNLLSAFPFKHKFDVVFCRNVLIYFDRETNNQIIDKITEVLRPGGYLFVGHSETGVVRNPKLKPITSAVYQKSEAA